MALLSVAAAAIPPLLPMLRGEIPGHANSDLADHVQGAWWWGGEVLSGRIPWQVQPGIMFPDGGILWYADPIGAAFALPFRLLGPARSFSIATLLQCALGALSAFWLGWRVSPRTAWITGVLCGSSPYVISVLQGGFSEYLGVWTVHLFVGAILDWMGEGKRPWAPPVALVFAVLQSFYFGVFCGVFTLLLVVGPEPLRRLGRAAVAVVPAAVVVAPLYFAARFSVDAPTAIMAADVAPGWDQSTPPGIDLLSFVAPWDYYFPDTPRMGNPGIVHVNALGWIALALAGFGFFHPRAPRWRWAALAWLVLALGPTLIINGSVAQLFRTPVPLPGRLLYFPGSPFHSVHHPYRMVALTLPLLGMLAAIGASRWRWGWALAPLILVESWCLSPAPFPLAGTPPGAPTIYALAPDGPVFDIPPDLRGPNRWYVLWSLEHGRPVPYGVANWLSRSLRADTEVQSLLASIDVRRRAINRDVPLRSDPWLAPVDHGGLRGLGFRSVVVHGRWLDEAERSAIGAWLTQRFGAPIPGEDETWLWTISE